MSNYKIPKGWSRVDPKSEIKYYNNLFKNDSSVHKFTDKQHIIGTDNSGNYLVIDETSGKPQVKEWIHDYDPHKLHDAHRSTIAEMGLSVPKYAPTELEKKLIDKKITTRDKIKALNTKDTQHFEPYKPGTKKQKASNALSGLALGLMGGAAAGQKFLPKHQNKAVLGGMALGTVAGGIIGKKLREREQANNTKNHLNQALNHYNRETDYGKYASEESSIDKVAFYKEEIMEKAASRSWKSHIGELSNDAIKALKKKGILDHAKELAGLNKGTENIVKKHKGVIGHFSAEETANMIRNEIPHNKAITKQIDNGAFDADGLANIIKNQHNATNGFMTISGHNQKAVIKGRLKKGNMIDDLMDGLPRRKFNQKYTEAVLNRHEADELRFGQNSFKGKKNNIKVDGQPAPAGNYASHISPKVLGAESTNVALAPGAVKKKMMELREGTGEADALKDSGFDFGRSGKYNKQINAKMQRMQVAANKPVFKSIYED